MPKPILLSVDDDSDVLRAIERDLRSQYGAEYRVIGSDSPEGALDLLKQLKVRNDSVALLLADHAAHGRGGILAAGNGKRCGSSFRPGPQVLPAQSSRYADLPRRHKRQRPNQPALLLRWQGRKNWFA